MVTGFTETISLETPLPCRYCGRPSYLAEAGEDRMLHPLHPCCRFWIGEQNRRSCVACVAFNTRQDARPTSRPKKKERQHQSRDPDEDDDLLLVVLGRLRKASGLWVDQRVISALVGWRARDLLIALIGAEMVEMRSSSDGNQYRIV